MRPALATLWRLDERLAGVVRATREGRLGEIRLAWWREALGRLDAHAPPDEPMLREVAAGLIGRGLSGAALGDVAAGWAALLAPLDAETLQDHAARRGAGLFRQAGLLLGDPAPELAAAGAGWALVDVAFHLRDADAAERALILARAEFAKIPSRQWPARLRSLGALAVLAEADAAAGLAHPRRPGSPRRVARVLAHRLTGR